MVESRRAWCGSARAGGKEKARSSTAGHVSPPTPMLDALIVIILAITILLLPLPPLPHPHHPRTRPGRDGQMHVMSCQQQQRRRMAATRVAEPAAVLRHTRVSGSRLGRIPDYHRLRHACLFGQWRLQPGCWPLCWITPSSCPASSDPAGCSCTLAPPPMPPPNC